MARRPARAYKREVCPYDGTTLYDGEPCPKCEENIHAHLADCWRCAGDYADLRRRDAEHGE